MSCMFGLLLHFGKTGTRLTFGRKAEEKLKLILDDDTFFAIWETPFWCFVKSVTWENGEKTVPQM